MALILIDVFTFPSATEGDEVYELYFNDVAISMSVVYTGSDGVISPVSEAQRQRTTGDLIGTYPNNAATNNYPITATYSTPFASIGTADPIDPLPPSCDLAMSVAVTNETAQDAGDGTAILTATSTYTGVQVSIDEVTWYSSPQTFVGFVGGNYIAYAKDDNGCTLEVPFTIVGFDNPIEGGFDEGLPQVEVSAGNISKWNAAFNPIVLKFQNTPDPDKKNFRIEIEITAGDEVVTGVYSPNPSGFTRADISAYLKSLVNANDEFLYDVLNWRDLNRAASFVFRYREVWDGDTSVWYDAPYPFYVTWSAKQLGDKYGGNMAEYVTFSDEPNPDLKAKWLTLFQEPTAWVGLPYDNSFILSEYVVDEEIKLRTTSLDINRNEIGAASNLFLINNDAGYIIADDDSRLIIQNGALPPVANDGIFEALGINRLMLAGLPATNVEYFVIQLYTGSDEAPNFITQPLTIKINRPCTDPDVYIKWLNTLGGWDYWRFGKDQILQLSTSDDITIDRNVFDWENDETIADTISKNAFNRISFGATVSDLKVNGLKGLNTSTKIQMLTSLDPLKWQTVILANGSFEIKRSRNKYSDLRFTVTLPQINIQQQ